MLPAELRDTVLTSLHDHMGHMGVDRTLDLVRTRFFWPKMALDVGCLDVEKGQNMWQVRTEEGAT